MKWRPSSPASSKKFMVKLTIKKIEGFDTVDAEIEGLMAEIKWKGTKSGIGLRKKIKNCTKELQFDEKIGFLEWNEEFESVCGLIVNKENGFYPWEIKIKVFNVSKHGTKKKAALVGAASLNLADFASGVNEINDISLSLSQSNVESHHSLNLTIRLMELGHSQESFDTILKSPASLSSAPLSPSSGDSVISEKDESSSLMSGLRKVMNWKDFVSIRKAKKNRRDEGSSEGNYSYKSEDVDSPYPFDNDSSDSNADVNRTDSEEEDLSVIKSCNYGPLAVANFFGEILGEQESLTYYRHNKLDLECPDNDSMVLHSWNQDMIQSSKKSILPWRKRKLGFRSPKAKGEPLLKKGNRAEGGDDIDYDRRLLSSSDDSRSGLSHKPHHQSQPEFGDDQFSIGTWEAKEIASRDNDMRLKSSVFFASIDQRSERAEGESACTTLVAVIADWFQTNPNLMPIKSQFDALIRDGSLEWRNLCKNPTLLQKFPDKHFDLETVLQSKVRPITVNSNKSFIGFFNTDFDLLHGTMSFDTIWEEISKSNNVSESEGIRLYIVSWNDHFFVLAVDTDAYYIIDTLGERLYEGCDQAYILKFDAGTVIHKIPEENNTETYLDELICMGKETCKEYIKSFLAAIPIRELKADIEKGLNASVHQRLQIEFHYIEMLKE